MTTIKWDPKVRPSAAPMAADGSAPAGAPPSRAAAVPLPVADKPSGLEAPAHARTHPSRLAPPTEPAAIERAVERLRHELRGARAARLTAAAEALALTTSYAMRRARGSRRLAAELCNDVAVALPEEAPAMERLRQVLASEDALQETTEEATLRACRLLVDLLLEEPT